jgi:hypothetical protein
MSKKIDDAFGEEIMAAYCENPKESILSLWEEMGKSKGVSYNTFLAFINDKLYNMIEKARKESGG